MVAASSVRGQGVRVEAAGDEAGSLAEVSAAMTEHGAGAVSLTFPDSTLVALPLPLIDVLRASARELASGHAVTVLPAEAALSPTEAAELLGLSRPFVVRLLDQGEIPSDHLPGSRHRRIRLADALAFAERRDRRREGRERLAAAIADAELPY